MNNPFEFGRNWAPKSSSIVPKKDSRDGRTPFSTGNEESSS
jgi:hypothetical protein